MTLSDFSIQRPVFAWILMFGLIFFGALSFTKMGINENPDVEYPTISIRYSYDGATPEVIEKDVVEPVESVLISMQGIRNMTSTSDRGSAQIELEFDLDRDTDIALQEVNTLLARAQRLLPDSLEPPVTTKSNAADQPILYLALTTTRLSQREMMILFRDRVQDRISTVDGVAEVRPFGYHEPVLRVDLKPDLLRRFQLTAGDVVSSIQREHEELPAGKFEYQDREDLIRVMGEVSEVSEFENIVISRRGGSPNYQPIRLKQVATLREDIEPLRRISRVNGVQALGMAVQKQRGVNTVATADRVLERIKEINSTLPEGTELFVNFDRTTFIRESVNELLFTLILSALLTSIVCFVFIGSWSGALNILLAIPTAVVGTFILIHQLGFTLNTFSILGLTLAIGVVVDDAIVMLENITRYVQLGMDRVNAAFKGAREISFAVIATTVALVSIFIPIAFMGGIEGRFFYEFVVTISIAVGLSSVEALTLAPMRCSQFLKLHTSHSGVVAWVNAFVEKCRMGYRRALDWSFHYRWIVVIGAFLIFVASLGTLKVLSTELVPAQDRGSLFLIFMAPQGKSLSYTSEKAKEFEQIAMAHPGVERIFVAIGGFGQGGQGNRGNGVIILKESSQRSQSQFEIATDLRKKAEKEIKGIQFFIRDRTGSAIGGRRGSPIEFTIQGPDPLIQKKVYHSFLKKMKADPQIVGTRSDDVFTIPEIHLVPDRAKAIQRGVEVSTIAETVNATLGGITAAQYTKGGRRFNILVQLEEEGRKKPEDIQKILVRNNRGELLPLSEVVHVEKTRGPQIVFRENRVRGIRVDASLAEGAAQGNVVQKIKEWSEEVLPPKYSIEFSSAPSGKLFEVIGIIVLGLIVAYMILASQFNSFVDPLIVFLAIPFSLSGAFAALLIGGQTLNLYSVIGILLTMGIVKKNSILLVEFTNQLRDRGYSIEKALKEACDTRLRPILMTNIATLAAALPAALSIGAGSETRLPLALTVMGGVSVSLPFTLIVVPCVYSLVRPKRIHILEESPQGALPS